VTETQWLLGFHLVGAFLFVSGAVAVGVLHSLALRRERPSEIVVLFRLTRLAVVSVMVGMTLALAFGLWLVADLDLVKWTDAWVISAIVLWFIANALGSNGGRRDRHARELAERLAAEGDQPSSELRGMMRDPITLAMSWGSGLAVIVILILMIWKPGH